MARALRGLRRGKPFSASAKESPKPLAQVTKEPGTRWQLRLLALVLLTLAAREGGRAPRLQPRRFLPPSTGQVFRHCCEVHGWRAGRQAEIDPFSDLPTLWTFIEIESWGLEPSARTNRSFSNWHIFFLFFFFSFVLSFFFSLNFFLSFFFGAHVGVKNNMDIFQCKSRSSLRFFFPLHLSGMAQMLE